MTDYAGTFERYFREYSDNGLDRRRTISYQFRAWRYYRCRKTISPQGRWYANLYLDLYGICRRHVDIYLDTTNLSNFLNGDPGRIAAQVLTGIGFLGAGAIIQSHGSVHGLTTAACIWVMAVVGLAAGAGMFLAASITTAFTLFVLVSLERLERRMYLDGVNKILTIICSTSTPDLKGIRKILENRSIFIVSLSYEHNYDKNTSTITYKVNVKSKSSYSELFTEIRKLGYISQIRLLA